MVMGLGQWAHGQGTPFMLRLGLDRPSSGKILSINQHGFIGGLSYLLADHAIAGNTSINLDFRRVEEGGNSLDTWALSYDLRFPMSAMPTGKFRGYGGFGVGVFRHQIEGTTTTGGGGDSVFRRRGTGGSSGGGSSGGGTTTSFSETETRLGLKLILGVWLSDRFFIESDYRFTGSIRGAQTDSFNLMVGIRF